MKTRKARGLTGRMQVQMQVPAVEYRRANNWKVVQDNIDRGAAQDVVPIEWKGSTGIIEKGWKWRVEVSTWISAGEWEKRTGERHAYGEKDFYCGTRADFFACDTPSREPDEVSDFGSQYWYEPQGVIRRADHWGSVASCVWNIDADMGVSQSGMCRWEDFHPVS